jgi:predicted peptidase
MKTLIFACFAAVSVIHAETGPEAGKQVAQALEVKDEKGGKEKLRYWLALPPAEEKKPEAGWPLMIFLHGAGERGDNLEQVKQHGPPKLIGKEKALNSFIVASPQCPTGRWWDVKEIKQLVDHLSESQPVDRSRIVMTGLSMGGFGTWGFLAEYPDVLAAAVPICGGGKPETAVRFKAVPLHCYHGAKDNVVPQSKSDEMIEALKKAGGKPQYTIFPEAGHDSWTDAYATGGLYKWLLEQRRAAK